MLDNVLNFISIFLAILIILLVVLQAKASGFSTVFGGGNFQTTRRGGEKMLHYLTIICVVIFCLFSLTRVLIF
ncbi:preprotein translocase subunit SecG [Patescibacteria group bacterium]|nr:preprotein translocase subunit SecG [Patescibacteria group bacterium]